VLARLLPAALALLAACAAVDTAPHQNQFAVYTPLGNPGNATGQPAPTLTYLRTETKEFEDGSEFSWDILLMRNDTASTFQYLSQDGPSRALARTFCVLDGAWVETTWRRSCGSGTTPTPIGPGEERELRVVGQTGLSRVELCFGGKDSWFGDMGPEGTAVSGAYVPPERE
jgi:hypothetical protein